MKWLFVFWLPVCGCCCGFLVLFARRGGWIDDRGVVFHFLFLLHRRVDDCCVLLDGFLLHGRGGRGGDTRVTAGEKHCGGGNGDGIIHSADGSCGRRRCACPAGTHNIAK